MSGQFEVLVVISPKKVEPGVRTDCPGMLTIYLTDKEDLRKLKLIADLEQGYTLEIRNNMYYSKKTFPEDVIKEMRRLGIDLSDVKKRYNHVTL